MSQPTRRHILASLGAAASVSALPRSAEAASPVLPPDSTGESRTDGAPWSLLTPLGPGSSLDLGWSLRDLEPPRDGACVLTLSHPRHGDARVHLCRRSGPPVGVAHTERLDLLLMNGGTGDRASRESLGRVLLGLADHLRARDESGALAELLPSLRSHDERLRAYADSGTEALV